jgi:BolA family transcriptional regulator, general stress-responsive regulator
MDTPSLITDLLRQQLHAELVEILDDSDRHKHHRGRISAPVGSGHFNLLIVSPQFEGLSLMQQHRLIYSALAEQMQTSIHALSIRSYSPSQWAELGEGLEQA